MTTLLRGSLDLWVFSGVMVGVAAIALFGLLDPGVCWFPEAGWGFQPATCLEFWLNRYQTLIGVLVAIVAGAAAWEAARRQLELQWESGWRQDRYRFRQILSVNNSVAESLDDLLNITQFQEELGRYRFSLRRQQILLAAHLEELARIKGERSFLRDSYRFVVANAELETAIVQARTAIQKGQNERKRLLIRTRGQSVNSCGFEGRVGRDTEQSRSDGGFRHFAD